MDKHKWVICTVSSIHHLIGLGLGHVILPLKELHLPEMHFSCHSYRQMNQPASARIATHKLLQWSFRRQNAPDSTEQELSCNVRVSEHPQHCSKDAITQQCHLAQQWITYFNSHSKKKKKKSLCIPGIQSFQTLKSLKMLSLSLY